MAFEERGKKKKEKRGGNRVEWGPKLQRKRSPVGGGYSHG